MKATLNTIRTLRNIASIMVMFILLLNAFSALSQAELAKQFTTTVAPMAPNAAALSKYVDVPVSYYTGTPQIAIPIYEINSKSLSLPISLNYHASGIRVDDVASWVGLGQTL